MWRFFEIMREFLQYLGLLGPFKREGVSEGQCEVSAKRRKLVVDLGYRDVLRHSLST